MRNFWFILSIIFTLFVFFMSTLSGDSSGAISSGISYRIYELLKPMLSWFSIDLELFHRIVRKLAHITEYFILAVLWSKTFSIRHYSMNYLFLLGLLIALFDEGIQMFSDSRGPSLFDVFVYDYVSYFIGVFLSIRFMHLDFSRI